MRFSVIEWLAQKWTQKHKISVEQKNCVLFGMCPPLILSYQLTCVIHFFLLVWIVSLYTCTPPPQICSLKQHCAGQGTRYTNFTNISQMSEKQNTQS